MIATLHYRQIELHQQELRAEAERDRLFARARTGTTAPHRRMLKIAVCSALTTLAAVGVGIFHF